MAKKIVVVDDDIDFLSELEEALRLCDYEVRPFSDPAQVRQAAVLDKPDLFLLDMRMHGKSGLQLASELSEDFGLNRPPVIVMTGYFSENELSQMRLDGIKACYTKPFDLFDMLSKIKKLLHEPASQKDFIVSKPFRQENKT
ncbi:MAG: response regulator [Candidatus Omnitrophica bacterium]|nr:response regulator [Candidatus Omnitrophota bacterium]MDD5670728.1 response regulator [Candidatus Omnitrophota bacterium]